MMITKLLKQIGFYKSISLLRHFNAIKDSHLNLLIFIYCINALFFLFQYFSSYVVQTKKLRSDIRFSVLNQLVLCGYYHYTIGSPLSFIRLLVPISANSRRSLNLFAESQHGDDYRADTQV